MLFIVKKDRSVESVIGNLNIGDTATDIVVVTPFTGIQTCKIKYTLPNGQECKPAFATFQRGKEFENGSAYVMQIPKEMNTLAGEVKAHIVLTDTKAREFVSNLFTFPVDGIEALPFPESEEQGSDFMAILEAIAATYTAYVENLENAINEAVDKVEKSKKAALDSIEKRATDAENAATTAISSASAAETAANEAKSSAETANTSAQNAASAASSATQSAQNEVVRLVGELGVVQSMGGSPVAVMSQKAVTDILVAAGARIAEVENLVEDGNFKKSETDLYGYWTRIGSISTYANNIATATGNGAKESVGIASNSRPTVNTGERYFYRAVARVTNSVCKKILVTAFGGYGKETIEIPSADEWYTISGIAEVKTNGNFAPVMVEAYYSDATTASGTVVEIKEVIAFKITEDYGETPSVDDLANIVDMGGGYWEGTQCVLLGNDYEDRLSELEDENVEIVQTTGNDETKVMSQGAVTDSLVAAGANIAEVENLVNDGNFKKSEVESYTYWAAINSTRAFADNIATVTGNGTGEKVGISSNSRPSVAAGEQYFYRATVRVTNSVCEQIVVTGFGGYGKTTITSPVIDEWYTISGIAKISADGTQAPVRIEAVYADADNANGKVVEIKEVVSFKITDDFSENPSITDLDKFVDACGGYWDGAQTMIVGHESDVLKPEVEAHDARLETLETTATTHEARLETLGEIVGNVCGVVTNLVGNGNFNGTGTWATNDGTVTASENTLTLVGNSTQAYARVVNITKITFAKDQPFVVHFKVRVTNGDCQQIKLTLLGGYASVKLNNPEKDRWYDITTEITPSGAGTQNALWFDFTYADAETANGKIHEIKEVMLFDTSVDFGLGVTPPIRLIQDMIETNGYWEGAQEVTMRNTTSTLNNAADEYILPKPIAFHSRERKPVVTFVCDDCHMADFEKLCAVSEKYGVAFTSARFAKSGLKEGLALYLQNEMGWEFASHTHSHVPLATLATEAEIENELKKSREYMASIGLKCDTLVYPEGSNDERVRRIAKKYFKCAATTNTRNNQNDMSEPAGINTGVIASFYLKRYPLGSFSSNDTLENHKGRVDEAIVNNGWLIFMLHPAHADHTDKKTAMICELIEYIQEKGVEIKTLRDGYEDFKNAIEIGDYIGGDEGCAISATGEKANF